MKRPQNVKKELTSYEQKFDNYSFALGLLTGCTIVCLFVGLIELNK